MDKECLVMFWFVPFFLSPSPPEKKSQPVEWRSVGYDRSRFTLLCLARVSVPDSSSRSPCLYTPCTVFFFFFFFFFLSLSLSLLFPGQIRECHVLWFFLWSLRRRGGIIADEVHDFRVGSVDIARLAVKVGHGGSHTGHSWRILVCHLRRPWGGHLGNWHLRHAWHLRRTWHLRRSRHHRVAVGPLHDIPWIALRGEYKTDQGKMYATQGSSTSAHRIVDNCSTDKPAVACSSSVGCP